MLLTSPTPARRGGESSQDNSHCNTFSSQGKRCFWRLYRVNTGNRGTCAVYSARLSAYVPMRIFVIAPSHANLPDATIEISAIDRRHQATILRGHVRDPDIAEKLDVLSFDVIWWISHGNAEGILLSDGLLSIGGVRQYLRTSGARLGVLNTCESESVARSIAIGGNADMICTIGEIDNKDAIRLGSLLAVELAKADDF